MLSLRYALPALLFLIGVGFLVVRGDTLGLEMWAMLTGSAISVLLFNLLYRMGAAGDADRRREAQARDHYSEHGRWPDE